MPVQFAAIGMTRTNSGENIPGMMREATSHNPLLPKISIGASNRAGDCLSECLPYPAFAFGNPGCRAGDVLSAGR